MPDPFMLALGCLFIGAVFGFVVRGVLSLPQISVDDETPQGVDLGLAFPPRPRAVGPDVVRNGCPHGTDCFMPEACTRRGQCGGKPVTFAWPPPPAGATVARSDCPNAAGDGKCFRAGRCITPGACPHS